MRALKHSSKKQDNYWKEAKRCLFHVKQRQYSAGAVCVTILQMLLSGHIREKKQKITRTQIYMIKSNNTERQRIFQRRFMSDSYPTRRYPSIRIYERNTSPLPRRAGQIAKRLWKQQRREPGKTLLIYILKQTKTEKKFEKSQIIQKWMEWPEDLLHRDY